MYELIVIEGEEHSNRHGSAQLQHATTCRLRSLALARAHNMQKRIFWNK
jgi:hypothetical protein